MKRLAIVMLFMSFLNSNGKCDSPLVSQLDLSKMNFFTVSGIELSLNTEYSYFIKLFGIGSSEEIVGYDKVSHYPGFTIYCVKKYIYDAATKLLTPVSGEYVIKKIEIVGKELTLSGNIALGSTASDVRKIFGVPYIYSDSKIKYTGSDISETWNLTFMITNGIVKQIVILRGD